MTDSTPPETGAIPDPAVGADSRVMNGQRERVGSPPQQQQGAEQQENTESQGEGLNMDHEMKITESIEDRVLYKSHIQLGTARSGEVNVKLRFVFPLQFDATLDVLSSVIVLWRYSNAAAVHSAHREYIACVILGVIFVLSSLCIMGKAIHDLATKLLPEVDDFLFSVSIVSGLVCAILAVIKFMLGKVLTSRALITDGFNSLVGAIMGFSILISAEVFKHEPKVWYLDGTVGVFMGLIILAYGVKLLLDMVPRVRQTRNYERFE
ncbi:transmembrane protein 163-like [Nothobranchius furzeri]|uniref:Transmembrane protein 163-like n=1 Tax=Nothobranchius furzeri TaxID=105023 RepID=A0A9D2Y650_NOTFU|nr:transmembrane protein 163-like [Nothobranchius furzeri]